MPRPFSERPLSLETPLGSDALLLAGMRGSEGIFQLFRFELDAVAENGRRIPFEALLGQKIGVQVRAPDAPARTFWGICSRVSQGARDPRYTRYELELVPQVWLLTRRRGLRIFQNLTAPQVLEQVLAGQNASFQLQSSYQQHEMLVQYRETDFAFASRLMEEAGIFYFFKHTADGHQLVVADSPQSHPDLARARFDARATSNTVFSWEKTQELATGRYALRDHDFESPRSTIEGQAAIQESVAVGTVEHRLKLAANEALELYDFPGSYAQRFDGDDRARQAAAVGMQGLAAASLGVGGASTVPGLTAGHAFTLEQHGEGDGKYVLTGIQHTAELPDLNSPRLTYRNEFTCIPDGLPFRPPRTTREPVVGGVQTAIVVAPPGGPVTDTFGRVKVKFHWDREGKSSSWIRVSQPHTGSSGAFWLPEVDDEVLVAFEEGDPDRPYIIGRLWNHDDPPPDRREGGR